MKENVFLLEISTVLQREVLMLRISDGNLVPLKVPASVVVGARLEPYVLLS